MMTFRRMILCLLAIVLMAFPMNGAHAQNQVDDFAQAIAQLKKRLDQNGDGRIAKSETTGLLRSRFDRLDSNSDGVLDDNEIQIVADLIRTMQSQRNSAKKRSSQVPPTVVLVENLVYREGKSDKWKLDLVYPKEKTTKPRPAIVFVHGGGWRSGDKAGGMWRSTPISYAEKGYVCISVNYRLTDEAPFPACVEDCKCAVRWLRANASKYNVDPDRIGAFGVSAGAHLVAMLGLVSREDKLEGDGPHQEFSSGVSSVCCSAAPTNFLDWYGTGIELEKINGTLKQFFGTDKIEQVKEIARISAPISYVKKGAVPFMVIQGTADRVVPVHQGDCFVDALKKQNNDVTYLRYEGAGHGVYHQHKEETYPKMEAFFERTLRQPGANIKPDLK